MKSVLTSIQPKWCELIASGKKTVEVRKTRPKIDTPFKCYIYMTAGYASIRHKINGYPYITHFNGGKAVIGEFVCDFIDNINLRDARLSLYSIESCVDIVDLFNYADGKSLYFWHISDLVIYDKSKWLSEFYPIKPQGFTGATDKEIKRYPLTRPPQSWCYVEEIP